MIRVVEGVAEDAKAPSAGAKSLCIPHDQERFGAFPNGDNQKCIQCGEKAKRWTMFGRSKSILLVEIEMEQIADSGQVTRWFRLGGRVERAKFCVDSSGLG